LRYACISILVRVHELMNTWRDWSLFDR